MTIKNLLVAFALGSSLLLSVGAVSCKAQSHVNSPDPLLGTPSVATESSHIGNITGHAECGQTVLPAILYRLPRSRRQRRGNERAVD